MHKKIILFCLVFLLLGCSKINDTKDYINLVNNCLNNKVSTNNVAIGYKYYTPKGVTKIQDYNYNHVFLIDNNKVYLYVDIISYFYKKELKHKKNDHAAYYEEIQNDKKNGYIEIIKEEEKYFLKIDYNYSRIETYVKEKDLNKMVTLSTIILNSIKYNNKVIEKVLARDFGEFSELTYKVDKPEDAKNNFSQYLEEYVQKEKKEDNEKEKIPDE